MISNHSISAIRQHGVDMSHGKSAVLSQTCLDFLAFVTGLFLTIVVLLDVVILQCFLCLTGLTMGTPSLKCYGVSPCNAYLQKKVCQCTKQISSGIISHVSIASDNQHECPYRSYQPTQCIYLGFTTK